MALGVQFAAAFSTIPFPLVCAVCFSFLAKSYLDIFVRWIKLYGQTFGPAQSDGIEFKVCSKKRSLKENAT